MMFELGNSMPRITWAIFPTGGKVGPCPAAPGACGGGAGNAIPASTRLITCQLGSSSGELADLKDVGRQIGRLLAGERPRGGLRHRCLNLADEGRERLTAPHLEEIVSGQWGSKAAVQGRVVTDHTPFVLVERLAARGLRGRVHPVRHRSGLPGVSGEGERTDENVGEQGHSERPGAGPHVEGQGPPSTVTVLSEQRRHQFPP